ncbi:hypothetical protein ACJMK2_033552, partial [Sinanodonta woodiana]
SNIDKQGSNDTGNPGKDKGNQKDTEPRTNALSPPSSGQLIRLAGDDGFPWKYFEGRVEVYVGEKWGIVCDDNWDIEDAHVACRQLGFVSGAQEAVHSASFGTGSWDNNSILMDEVSCQGDEATLSGCSGQLQHDCTQQEAAGVRCVENSGCLDDWIAGTSGCYKLSSETINTRDLAVDRCAEDGGHLLTIETERENNFISNVLYALGDEEFSGSVLTGGVRRDNVWVWPKVTSIPYFKWFPGWMPDHVQAEPSNKKYDECIFLEKYYEYSTGSKGDVGYYFWKDDRCNTTKTFMPNGYHYMCEIEKEQLRVSECYVGNGEDYRGHVSTTQRGSVCLKWNDPASTLVNPKTHPGKGLGDHSYCRNPDNDQRPWCWVSHILKKVGLCDIPKCGTEQTQTDPTTTITTTASDMCDPDNFFCSSDAVCIPSIWKCDNESDCSQGEDEVNCEYKLPLFSKFPNRGWMTSVEAYEDIPLETCARDCMQTTKFVCRSFSYSTVDRYCYLSDRSSQNFQLPPTSLRMDYYELKGLTSKEDCEATGMLTCDNSRCVGSDKACDGVDDCGDSSDESEGRCAETVNVRLRGGRTKYEGNVVVTKDGKSGYICDDEWEDNDARVICRMLGFRGGKAYSGGHFRAITALSGIILDDVQCTGIEPSISQCLHKPWGQHDCTDKEYAGVSCLNPDVGPDINTTTGSIECGKRPLMSHQQDESEIKLTASPPKIEHIIGGMNAVEGANPWQAAIRIISNFSKGSSHWCGATILSEYWILSAAHCFRNHRKSEIVMRTGDYNNKVNDDHEQEFVIDLLIPHKKFNDYSNDYDIALIKIQPQDGRGIVFNDYVQPACLPESNTEYEAGMKCHISGWGLTSDNYPNILQSARIPIINESECNTAYKGGITPRMFCAGYMSGRVDSCFGDSGGPLVCDIQGKYTVLGITSWGRGCALRNSPGVYTKVKEFLPWINKKMQL